jgi:hypothetical protein
MSSSEKDFPLEGCLKVILWPLVVSATCFVGAYAACRGIEYSGFVLRISIVADPRPGPPGPGSQLDQPDPSAEPL